MDKKDYNKGKKIIGVQLTDSLYKELLDYAASNGFTVSTAVRFLIMKGLKG